MHGCTGRPPAPCLVDVQGIVTARFVKIVTISAECSHFADIWTSSQINRSLFCCRLARQMHDVLFGDIDGLDNCLHEKVLAAFDDWRWDICRLRGTPVSVVVGSLTRALQACLSPEFRPAPPSLVQPALDCRAIFIGHDVLGAPSSLAADDERLAAAQRRFRKVVRRAAAA